ncbi:unnamed protein product [Phytophthora fragariaefolia]|uniref:Unnamed protein product n=1 Tax=Phytophthora fragariaefolia TaxID=1490495 RepID=A0A9W6YLT9_9STRA|nr:unnamed protein product [Phytophthora fragariaefolia]
MTFSKSNTSPEARFVSSRSFAIALLRTGDVALVMGCSIGDEEDFHDGYYLQNGVRDEHDKERNESSNKAHHKVHRQVVQDVAGLEVAIVRRLQL